MFDMEEVVTIKPVAARDHRWWFRDRLTRDGFYPGQPKQGVRHQRED